MKGKKDALTVRSRLDDMTRRSLGLSIHTEERDSSRTSLRSGDVRDGRLIRGKQIPWTGTLDSTVLDSFGSQGRWKAVSTLHGRLHIIDGGLEGEREEQSGQ